MFASVRSAIAVMLLTIHLARSTSQSSNLELLEKLLGNIKKENSLTTLLIIQHHLDRNCEVQDWNQPKIPTLRFNQLARVEVRRHFNSQSAALVCIGKDSDLSLLDVLAEDFDRMRQERIILWIQKKVTHEMLQRISQQSELHKFVQVLIWEVCSEQGKILSTYRLVAFPHSQFVKVDKMFAFPKTVPDFKGRLANLLPNDGAIVPIAEQLRNNAAMPLHGQEKGHQIIEFARKYNLNLNVIQTSALDVTPDFLLNYEMSSSQRDTPNISPFDITALKVVVPCSRKRTIGDIFRRLDMTSSLIYILPVYATFVVVETIILVVTHRINGRGYQLTSLNLLLNLRAFRAILGLSFPFSRRANLSLRQLFLVISVFGLIFSNFFSCKLTALLTKLSNLPKVNNFDDLRASDLTVVVSPMFRTYIENEIDRNFFEETIIRVKVVSNADKARMLFSLNTSYAYIIYSDNWKIFDNYQKSFGRKVLCDSKDLTITHGTPRFNVLQKNSIFDWPLSTFLVRVHEAGMIKHWMNRSPYVLQKVLNMTPFQEAKKMEVPLSIVDLNWLWFLLGCGYGLAICVFIVELTLRGPGRQNQRPEARQNILVV